MNKTRRITTDWLEKSDLVGNALLLEALLRRGFLAYGDDRKVWIGTGSHLMDLNVLSLVKGLKVEPINGHIDRMALVAIPSSRVSAIDVAVRIVSIPENHFDGHNLWTGGAIPGYLGAYDWNCYRNMAWGAKLPTCPAFDINLAKVSEALDIGVALLVKVLPLARVSTGFSCDGHGENPAVISFCYDWDSPWAAAVFDVLADTKLCSKWRWEGGSVAIEPQGEYCDAEILKMLDDIQHFSRLLLNQIVIDKIGRSRTRTLEVFGSSEPTPDSFAKEARRQLVEAFS